ncbi:MAG: exodeoxyribonuclease VII large subunit [Prolixibacteraceae bacterium]|jgi:exodeoxyribonuclease VII large subunit|nr:exodeoxyribonuclease VII large subunit [Prolixibacteraceae bacterium]MBT6765410.1 exodeoxyribonuclease VII large subunit [Prolixibacteraceae bacterium]MBT6997752.1 exodeoxyribonuclease VII large subunit [Prolixibacteraceae bacterium]MBT7396391.1 exodeoxyribonuclease VII large subunit [Prolixibacteraceae bacterium]
MNQNLTLSELNGLIKDVLADTFSSAVWVVAEISELKENRSGHCYLELIEKEGDEIIARSRATIWSYTFRMLKPYFETSTGQLFTDGIKILVQVSVEFHPSFGLSLNIKDIDPTYTVGDLALQRKEIISRLQNDGVFDMNKELSLPLVPQKLALISSETAAGYLDFMDQLNSNEFGFRFHTKLFEAFMQGSDSVRSIIAALERIYRYEDFFDAVIIIRGGGATADLSSFDNYDLAFNVTQFPLPVITGIGHEKDDTIIDLVAHTRLKTPTAVAEFFINGLGRFYERLVDLENNVVSKTRETIGFKQNNLERIAESLNFSVSAYIIEKQNYLVKKGHELQQNVNGFSYKKKYELNKLQHEIDTAVSLWFAETRNKISHKKRILNRVVGEALLKKGSELVHLKDLFGSKSRKMLYLEKERVHLNENTVRLLNPENVLKRGFTLTLKDGRIVKSAKQLKLNEEIETQFADGKVKSKITKKENNGN